MDINASNSMKSFLALSALLTGFSEFQLQGTGQAQLYFDTVLSVVGEEILAELFQTFDRINTNSDASNLESQLRSEILGSEKLGAIARNIIKLWYVSTWYQLPAAWRDEFGTKANDRTFIPSPAAYPEGLLWPAIGVNPPGAKGLGYGVWSEPPTVSLTQS
ncbi:hypothetical protein H6G50_11935 [Oscillatoria sp. FACHB-1406]|nr:hypothetical protein [Oscillatoria sp. FACHB-1406]